MATKTVNNTAAQLNSAAKLAFAKTEFAAKKAAAKTPVAAAVEQQIDPVVHTLNTDAEVIAWRKLMMNAIDSFAPSSVSWTRRIIGWVVGFAAAFGAGYLVGMALNAVLATAIVSASLFLTVVCWIIGLMLAMYLGSKVGSAVSNGIIHKTMENAVVDAWHGVTGWFTTAKPVVAAPVAA